MMMSHNIRIRCWLYGSRGCTFPPIFHYVWIPCDIWKQRSSLIQWYPTWKCIWIKDVSVNSSMQKKLLHWHSVMLTQHLWAPNSGCEHREELGSAFQQQRLWYERQAMQICHDRMSIYHLDYDQWTVWSSISASMHWKWWCSVALLQSLC